MGSLSVDSLKLGAACFLLAIVFLGALGLRDSHQVKLPLAAIAGILGAAYFQRGKDE